MNDNFPVPQAWTDVLPGNAIATAYTLWHRTNNERAEHIIYPPAEAVFRALELTPPDKVKVVIVGQDPYHEPNQAMGLSFSVPEGVLFPPSLRNIFGELTSDLGVPYPRCGNLTKWAKQGVLLLNTVLTVEARKAASHADYGWQDFTEAVVKHCMTLPQPVVFLCWGTFAHRLVNEAAQSLTDEHQTIMHKYGIRSTHPSPMSATRPSRELDAFVGSHPFSRTNQLLIDMGGEPIDWSL